MQNSVREDWKKCRDNEDITGIKVVNGRNAILIKCENWSTLSPFTKYHCVKLEIKSKNYSLTSRTRPKISTGLYLNKGVESFSKDSLLSGLNTSVQHVPAVAAELKQREGIQ